MRRLLKQRNKIVGVILGGAALACLAVVMYQQIKSSPRHRGTVVINVGGKEQRLPLTLDIMREIRTESGYNRIVIKDGKVRVTEADCRDQVCVKAGEICCPHQTIACLPHKMIISIEDK